MVREHKRQPDSSPAKAGKNDARYRARNDGRWRLIARNAYAGIVDHI